jgi:hypothetical protein
MGDILLFWKQKFWYWHHQHEWMNHAYIYMIQKVNSWFSLINNCRTTKSGWVFLSWNARFSMNIAMMFPLPKNYFLNLAFPNF